MESKRSSQGHGLANHFPSIEDAAVYGRSQRQGKDIGGRCGLKPELRSQAPQASNWEGFRPSYASCQMFEAVSVGLSAVTASHPAAKP